MDSIAQYAGILALIANFFWIPAMNYFIDKRIEKKMEPIEARIMKAIADQKIQIDREYLDLRDSIDRKFDKFDMILQETNRMINAVVASSNERMTKTEIDLKGVMVELVNGSKHYEAFQKTQADNFNRVHQRLDEILREIHK